MLEGGMPRFFRRREEGVFDQEDLSRRTLDLSAFVDRVSEAYGFDPGGVAAVGFSNGANMAASLLPRRPGGGRSAGPAGGGPASRRGGVVHGSATDQLEVRRRLHATSSSGPESRPRSRALIATMMVETDMRAAPRAGDRRIPSEASTPAARGMAITL